MNIKIQFLLYLLLGSVVPLLVVAQEESSVNGSGSSGEVFARQGVAVLTQTELDAAFSRIPAELRLRYIRDGARVNSLVASLLRTKSIAADAAQSDFDQNPLVANRMKLAAEKELAEAWVAELIENLPDVDYEALAREYYLANPDEFKSQDRLDVSHILIKSDSRSEDEALAIAVSLEEKLRADPSGFENMVEEYSEDPAMVKNAGRYPNMVQGQMVKPFEDAAFALKQPGEISGPVKTSYGYHIIRLNDSIPAAVISFDRIKEQAMDMAKKQYVAEYRIRYIKSQIAEPIEVSEGAVETMAKRYFGENFELAPASPE